MHHHALHPAAASQGRPRVAPREVERGTRGPGEPNPPRARLPPFPPLRIHQCRAPTYRITLPPAPEHAIHALSFDLARDAACAAGRSRDSEGGVRRTTAQHPALLIGRRWAEASAVIRSQRAVGLVLPVLFGARSEVVVPQGCAIDASGVVSNGGSSARQSRQVNTAPSS